MATNETGGTPGWRDLLEAVYLGLVALQAGVGALTLPDAWAVIVPLAVAVGVAFFARLAGRNAAQAAAATKVQHLQDEVGRLIIENGHLRQEMASLARE